MIKTNIKIRYKICILLLFSLVFAMGCAKKSLLVPYEMNNYSLPPVPRLAMMPLENLSDTVQAGKKIGDIFLVEFLHFKNISLVEPGNVEVALAEERVRNTNIMPLKTIRALAEKMDVDIIMIGTVMAFEMKQSVRGGAGSIPLISLSIRVLDVKTGNIVWAVNAIRKGDDTEKLFGFGKIYSIDRLAKIMGKEIADELSDFVEKHTKIELAL